MSVEMATTTKTCRLLYYGPAKSGKRDNLKILHRSIPPEQRLTLASADPERQIAFRVRHTGQEEWQVLVQAVDAGQERLRTAGMGVNPPFDGIVLVLPSAAAQLERSLAALESLKTYLDSWGLDLMGVPVVLQYNGRENPEILAVDRMESLLNPWGLLSYPSSSVRGEGIRETLKAVLGLTINHLIQTPRPEDEPPANMRITVPEPMPREQANVEADISPLGLEYGPPLPGEEGPGAGSVRVVEQPAGNRVPLVIPITLPRSLVGSGETLRITLEITIDEDS